MVQTHAEAAEKEQLVPGGRRRRPRRSRTVGDEDDERPPQTRIQKLVAFATEYFKKVLRELLVQWLEIARRKIKKHVREGSS